MKYIIINEQKVPQHSLDKPFDFDEVKDYPNLAVLIEEPFVVIDVDTENESQILYEICTSLKLKTNILKTDKGMHFWFKTSEPMTNTVKANTPLTLKIDVKSWGKKSLATIKKNGLYREWIYTVDELEEIPFWLKPIPLKKDLVGLKEGDGRDDGLFKYIIPLLSLKFSKPQIEVIFDLINSYVFKTPLSKKELDKMFENNNIFDESLGFFEKKEFQHHEFAKWLKTTYPIAFHNGQLYIYEHGLYTPNSQFIERLMIEKIPKLKSNQRVEVSKYLELICSEDARKLDPTIVNCKNGYVDIISGELIPHNKDIFTVNKVNAVYNEGTYDKPTDDFLNSISNNDKDIRTLLEEMIGYCFLNDCRFQKAFILIGQGANGKSVFLKMLKSLLGANNTSSVTLEEFTKNFMVTELVDKMANLGDDISGEFISDSSVFKKLASGEPITVRRIFQAPFEFENTSKLIFSANSLPPMSDKSYGLFRRLIIVPFLRKFTPETDGYDPTILNKVITENARSYLFDIGIKAIRKMIERGHFTDSDKVKEVLNDYEEDNNNCLSWLKTEPELFEIDIASLYRNYCLYCASINGKPMKKQRWSDEVVDKMPNVRLKSTTRNGKFAQVFTNEKKTIYVK